MQHRSLLLSSHHNVGLELLAPNYLIFYFLTFPSHKPLFLFKAEDLLWKLMLSLRLVCDFCVPLFLILLIKMFSSALGSLAQFNIHFGTLFQRGPS